MRFLLLHIMLVVLVLPQYATDIDSVVVEGNARVNVGEIAEETGDVLRSFLLRNAGTAPVAFVQGYTSCGCTMMQWPKDSLIAPGDSAVVTLRFNPQGKWGEFEEKGRLVYGSSRKHIDIVLTGVCLSSEETLLKQFPVRLSDDTRISSSHFDLGIMKAGHQKTMNIVVLHKDKGNTQEIIPVVFSVDDEGKKGLQRISRSLTIEEGGKQLSFEVSLDVFIK